MKTNLILKKEDIQYIQINPIKWVKIITESSEVILKGEGGLFKKPESSKQLIVSYRLDPVPSSLIGCNQFSSIDVIKSRLNSIGLNYKIYCDGDHPIRIRVSPYIVIQARLASHVIVFKTNKDLDEYVTMIEKYLNDLSIEYISL